MVKELKKSIDKELHKFGKEPEKNQILELKNTITEFKISLKKFR